MNKLLLEDKLNFAENDLRIGCGVTKELAVACLFFLFFKRPYIVEDFVIRTCAFQIIPSKKKRKESKMSLEESNRALVPRAANPVALPNNDAVFQQNLKAMTDYFTRNADKIIFQNMPQHAAGRSEFSNLERFIRQYRPTTVTDITAQHVLWLTKIAPSCVYPVRVHGEGLFYQCVLCNTPTKIQQSAVRHYREQHFDEMPPAIFGENAGFRCKLCKTYVGKRQEHLDMHYKSLGHLENLAAKGSVKAKQQVENYNEQVVEAKFQEKLEKKRKFVSEQDTWEALFRSDEQGSERTLLAVEFGEAATEPGSDDDSSDADEASFARQAIRTKKQRLEESDEDEPAVFIRADLLDSDCEISPCQPAQVQLEATQADQPQPKPAKHEEPNAEQTKSIIPEPDSQQSQQPQPDAAPKADQAKSVEEQPVPTSEVEKEGTSQSALSRRSSYSERDDEASEFEDAAVGSNSEAESEEDPTPKKKSCKLIKSLSKAFNLNVSLDEE